MKRRACAKRGHRFIESYDGFVTPVQFCSRWGCSAARPDPTLPEAVRDALGVSIEREQR